MTEDEKMWAMAIEDAFREIALLKPQIKSLESRKRQLENAIVVFRANMRDGVKWPIAEQNLERLESE